MLRTNTEFDPIMTHKIAKQFLTHIEKYEEKMQAKIIFNRRMILSTLYKVNEELKTIDEDEMSNREICVYLGECNDEVLSQVVSAIQVGSLLSLSIF